jgi:hypothetical protein
VKREDVVQQAVLSDSSPPAVGTTTEKRQHPRVAVSVGVEIVDTQTRTHILGRATDLGVGGCYVDTRGTFPEGTPVEVFLRWQERTLQLRALVSYAVNGRSVGMGLSFTGTSAEAGATLLDWVTGLRSEPPQAIPQSEPENVVYGGPTATKAQGLEETIDELVALLVNKQVLSQSEGAALRSRTSK